MDEVDEVEEEGGSDGVDDEIDISTDTTVTEAMSRIRDVDQLVQMWRR